MNLLLDTHVWIWTQEKPEKLGLRTRKLLTASGHRNCISSISTLEIARLVAIGEISVSIPLSDWVMESLSELAAESIPVTHDVAIEAYSLPGEFHADPVDRLLVATSRCYDLTLVTADNRILRYTEVRTKDARR